jgi:hypothetical protein
MFKRCFLEFLIVNGFSSGINAIGHNFEIGSGEVDGAAVSQVPAVGKVHTHNRVAGL